MRIMPNPDIMDFGRKSFVTWVRGLAERVEKGEPMPDKEYICLSCSETYIDGDTYCCSRCGAEICPKCGGDMTTIEEYDKAMREN